MAITVWPITTAGYDVLRPRSSIVGYSPIAMMTCGSIIGATITDATGGIQRRPPRVTANALSEPRMTDTTAVAAPISRLFQAACSQRGWFHTVMYHRHTSLV